MKEKQVALVTGASSGIGRATAELLAERGFDVFGTTRNLDGLESWLSNVEPVQLDVRDDSSVEACVRTVIGEAGRIDALVNNAGYTLIGALEETSIEEARDLFETNFFGALRLTRAVLPAMREQRHGRIVNIGSVAGFVPGPYQGIYSASKHALEGYSESLDHEVRQFGIRVSVVEPGYTRTRMDEHREIIRRPLAVYALDRSRVAAGNPVNIGRDEDPAAVASVVLKALTVPSPRLHYLAGGQARLVSLLRKFAPEGVFDRGFRKQVGLMTA